MCSLVDSQSHDLGERFNGETKVALFFCASHCHVGVGPLPGDDVSFATRRKSAKFPFESNAEVVVEKEIV